jgi:hypothetical protein
MSNTIVAIAIGIIAIWLTANIAAFLLLWFNSRRTQQ